MNDKFEQSSYWRIYLKLIFGIALFFASPTFGLAQTAPVEYAIAANHYTQGNWDEAIEAFGELIRQFPGSAESETSKFFIAEILMQQEEYQSAFRAYQNFYSREPHGISIAPELHSGWVNLRIVYQIMMWRFVR